MVMNSEEVKKSEVEASRNYKIKNKDKYNEYMRNYMKLRREGKTTSQLKQKDQEEMGVNKNE